MSTTAFPALRHWIAAYHRDMEPLNWFDGMIIGFLLGVLACLIAVVLTFHQGNLDD